MTRPKGGSDGMAFILALVFALVLVTGGLIAQVLGMIVAALVAMVLLFLAVIITSGGG